MAGSALVNINPHGETAEQRCDPGWGWRGWEAPAFTRRALVKGAKVSTLKTCSCFQTFDLTADSEPSRTLTGSGKGGEVSRGSLRSLPERWGRRALLPEAAAVRRKGHSKGPARVQEVGMLFGESKVPGSFLGTFPHGLHEPREAHVLGFLQTSHQPLLHDGDKLLIAQLSVAWKMRKRTGVSRDSGTKATENIPAPHTLSHFQPWLRMNYPAPSPFPNAAH